MTINDAHSANDNFNDAHSANDY